MYLETVIFTNVYAFLILIVLFFYSVLNLNSNTVQHKLFMRIMCVTAFLLLLDVISRLDGQSGTWNAPLNQIGNFLVFFVSPIIPSLWLLYAHDQIHHQGINRKLLYGLLALNMINDILVVLSLFFGWFYTIDVQNIYHRGPYFVIHASLAISQMIAAFVMILINRKHIDKQHFLSLLLFSVLPFTGAVLQTIFYGVSLILFSVTASILIVFINIQIKSMHTDYLTGVNNRKKLEHYLHYKIAACSEYKTFAAVMIDFDDFKQINDTYGHDVGDRALEISVEILRSCLRASDFIARYGGDEFFIVLDGVSIQKDLDAAIYKIKKAIQKYNEISTQPFKISFSFGSAVYDCRSRLNPGEFQKRIDRLMYESKKQKYRDKPVIPKLARNRR